MADEQEKPLCKYGVNCYQRNEAHKARFQHPTKDNKKPASPQTPKRKISTSPISENIEKKLKLASPKNNNQNLNESNESEDDDRANIRSDDEEGTGDKSSTICENSLSEQSSPELDSTRSVHDSFDVVSVSSSTSRTDELQLASTPTRTRTPTASPSPLSVPTPTQKSDPNSPEEKFIKSKFLVNMPEDFQKFWKFCDKESKSKSPENVFVKFGLRLVGPFDVMAKKFDMDKEFTQSQYLRHWRFFYDPPEFQTVMVKEKTGIHYGYWRDEPNGKCLIARNNAEENCEFTFIADNMFGAILYFLEKDVQITPFNRPAATALKKSLEQYVNEQTISLASFSAQLKARNSKVVSKTFHRAGLVVPFDRKTDVGYRPLYESDANLKKMLKKFTEAKGNKESIETAMDLLQPLITAANIACDEGDFGNSIELGIDLFCFGSPELHPVAVQLLSTGYSMVNRPEYIEIIKSHLEHRIKDVSKLSILQH